MQSDKARKVLWFAVLSALVLSMQACGGSGGSGASAKCNDGTLSYSQNCAGTCSSHGGVQTWYNGCGG
jgi:hypothetical protein